MMPSSHVRPHSHPILIWMVVHLWVFGSSLAQVGSQEASAPPTLTVDAFAYWDASVRQGYVDILVERGDALGGDLLVSAFQLRREQGTPIRGPLAWSTTWRWDDALDSRFLTRILLPEGGYVVRAELTSSQQTLTREIPIRIDYPKPLAGLSDVMPMVPGEPPIPRIDGRWDPEQPDLVVYTQSYHATMSPVRLVATLERDEPVDILPGGAFRGQERIVRSDTLAMPAMSGTLDHLVRFKWSSEPFGPWFVRLQLLDPDGLVLAERGRSIRVDFPPPKVIDWRLDDVIDQLTYIAEPAEMRALRAIEDADARREAWNAFWELRDPTPATPENERRDAYYYRIQQANQRFGGGLSTSRGDSDESPATTRRRMQGWQTDRGRIWVTYGEPDQLDRYPFNFGTEPYEIWTYYKARRRFVFVDERNLGGYTLLYLETDERTYLR